MNVPPVVGAGLKVPNVNRLGLAERRPHSRRLPRKVSEISARVCHHVRCRTMVDLADEPGSVYTRRQGRACRRPERSRSGTPLLQQPASFCGIEYVPPILAGVAGRTDAIERTEPVRDANTTHRRARP